jgi:transcriptional regulator with XRE-family HTH domain
MSRLKNPAVSVDRLVGARLKERRTMLGLSQDDLAQRIGITYQQLHKYENAVNRISASRLFLCAQELNAPIDYFFDDLGGARTAEDRRPRHRRSLSFSRAFNEISEAHLQRALVELARVLAESGGEPPRQDKSS